MKKRSWREAGILRIPELTIEGAEPGPTLAATAAVHGDEYEGVQALFEIFDELDPGAISGRFVALPVANPPAFWSVSRSSPLDRANLARAFPGSPAGAPTEVLAHTIAEELIARADFYLDLHSGGLGWAMPTMAGYEAADPRAHAAALAFGAPVVWGHPEIAPGRTVSYAKSRGIPFLYTEARGGGRVDPGDLAVIKRGIRNLLRHLGMLAEAVEAGPAPIELRGDGNIDKGVAAPADGFFTPAVRLLDPVEPGQRAGTLRDIQGQVIAEPAFSRGGIVVLVRELPVVRSGDPLVLVAEAN